MTEKQRIRAEIPHRIASLPASERIVLDAQIATHITHLPDWRTAETILAWVAMEDEVDLQSVMRAARAEGKRVALPRVDGREMRFLLVDEIPGSLEKHRYGFLQPSSDAAPAAIDANTLALVPGRAFDRSGHRVGRGGGYYDRFLAGEGSGCTSVGVCYDVQLLDRVPRESDDRPVHLIVTEHETCFCRRSV